MLKTFLRTFLFSLFFWGGFSVTAESEMRIIVETEDGEVRIVVENYSGEEPVEFFSVPYVESLPSVIVPRTISWTGINQGKYPDL